MEKTKNGEMNESNNTPFGIIHHAIISAMGWLIKLPFVVLIFLFIELPLCFVAFWLGKLYRSLKGPKKTSLPKLD